LYTARGNKYCIGLGVYANILTESNVFSGVTNPIESHSYSNPQSVVVSHDNLYVDAFGSTEDLGVAVFTPRYAYTRDDARGVQRAVSDGAGVCASRFVFDATPAVRCSAPSAEPVNAP
jgi:pectate lyase